MNSDAPDQPSITAEPAAVPPLEPVRQGRPARRLRDAFEPIAMHDVWCRQTNERMAALGLDRLTGYVWGRAAVMGEPAAAVVVAAFGVFEPSLITAAYERGRGTVPRAALLAARTEATVASLREVLRDADVAPAVVALRRGVEAAGDSGRPLFAGLRSLPWPEDPVGQLWRACDLLREHRGDSHIAASISAGLGPVAMNSITELWLGMPLGSYTATRGWSEATIAATAAQLERDGLVAHGSLTDSGRVFRDAIEARTDAMQAPVVTAIGDDFEHVVAQLNGWSARCIDAEAFTPDPYKRAAS